VRRKPDPGHGRRLLLTLTAKGERRYAAIAIAARRRHDNVLAALSATEREVLERVLGKLQARAAAMLSRRDLGFGGRLQSRDE
jgi:DNA-binding MarR family transcriptional regulator